MKQYENKKELIEEINKCAELFINEFSDVEDKNLLIKEADDRTPAQMISYQLGWMNLILFWESEESKGNKVVTPTPEYKWNNLGGLYKNFYKQYNSYSLDELIKLFVKLKDDIIELINNYTDEELFEQGMRKWSSSTASNWPIWKWIHINTVAPFKNFRSKIRKWKKLKNEM